MAPRIYQAYLAQVGDDGSSRHVSIYHSVRRIPYGATGNRDPISVIEGHRGSCSGKHLLLRDLLRLVGYDADVITIHTHFNKAIPQVSSFPEDLSRMVQGEEVHDFHHFVRARIEGEWLDLDATWHDALCDYGFPVNSYWAGKGHTTLAAEALTEYPAEEDIAAFKLQLLSSLSEEARDRRELFFDLLTGWMEAIAAPPAIEAR